MPTVSKELHLNFVPFITSEAQNCFPNVQLHEFKILKPHTKTSEVYKSSNVF